MTCTDGLLLKPMLRWQIDSAKSASFPAELAYITHGMNWHATYNVVLPETSETASAGLADILSWVTFSVSVPAKGDATLTYTVHYT